MRKTLSEQLADDIATKAPANTVKSAHPLIRVTHPTTGNRIYIQRNYYRGAWTIRRVNDLGIPERPGTVHSREEAKNLAIRLAKTGEMP